MRLLESLTVQNNRQIELYQGDLTAIPAADPVDVLVVSAFPNNYAPSPGTLIGALHDRGISLGSLAQDKAFDLRENFSCWLSQEIPASTPGIAFRRILCFEPRVRGNPSQVIGDIFQSLMPFVTGDVQISSVAMPLVATGHQGVPLVDMLEPLLEAVVHWMQIGLPLQKLRIVERSELRAAEMKGAFSVLKKRYLSASAPATPAAKAYKYDAFISYSHVNTAETLFLVEELRRVRPDIRLFFDRQELNAGAAWQYELYAALDDCRKVIALYSPTYLSSKVCREEYNIALFRHRETEDGVLIPLYLYSADLPTYMNLVQFIDCREARRDRLQAACHEIVAQL
jgi:hypothetical protein